MKAAAATFHIAVNRHEAEIIASALYAYQRIRIKAIVDFETYSEHQGDITSAALLEQDFRDLIKGGTTT